MPGNAVAGFGAGWFAMKTSIASANAAAILLSGLKMIGDLNHHVRNALQSIQLSAYSTQDQEIIASVGDSVQRIEWALRESSRTMKEGRIENQTLTERAHSPRRN